MNVRLLAALLFFLSAIVLLPACRSGFFSAESPRDAYASRLKKAGLDGTPMGSQWFRAGAQSLSQPNAVRLPYKEEGYFAAESPGAVSLRFNLRMWQRLTVRLHHLPDTGFVVFMELFRAGATDQPVATDTSGALQYEADQNEELILRLQPRLLEGGSYVLTLTTGPVLGYPVTNPAKNRIGSVWGDPRDAGARRHEGVDIFAPKGSPALAAAGGRITRLTNGGIGGKTVWLRPEGKTYLLYYAHLDSQLVRSGQIVAPGDTVGWVGNTGNARYTPAHLHFGIYTSDGAVDPSPFVSRDTGRTPAVTATPLIGKEARTVSDTRLLIRPDGSAPSVAELPSGSYVQVNAAAGSYYRVALPNGRTGWLLGAGAISLKLPMAALPVTDAVALTDRPQQAAGVKRWLAPGTSVKLLARSGSYRYVQAGNTTGWMAN